MSMAQQRYVFYFSMGIGTEAALRAARKITCAHGAEVIKAGVGTMLVEATPAKAAEVAKALPEWQYAPERKTTGIPERERLQRTKLKLAVSAAKG